MQKLTRLTRLARLCGILFMTGCAVPVTDGYYAQLPVVGARIMVTGNHISSISTAIAWLEKRGLSAVDQATLAQTMDDTTLRWARVLTDEAAILRGAKQADVDEVVFVEYSGDVRAPMVSVKAVSSDTNRIRWSGSARFTQYGKRPLNHSLATLTCHALATAWGYRSPGKEWLTSAPEVCQ